MSGRETTATRVVTASLRQLAQLCGVQVAYRDVFRRRRAASPESLLQALRALGVPLDDLSQATDVLRERHLELWRRTVEPVLIAWEGNLPPLALRLSEKQARGPAEFDLQLESGETKIWIFDIGQLPLETSQELEGTRFESRKALLPVRLPWGYHRLRVRLAGQEFHSLVVAAPVRAYEQNYRGWGLFLPLYSLHSKSSWGAGDFSDLGVLVDWMKNLGGSLISTLPFLASFLEEPLDASPYSPASRLFWNEFYVDPRRAEEFTAGPRVQQMVQSEGFQREIQALRAAPMVDYRRQMRLKRQALQEMARGLVREGSNRQAAFRRYVEDHPVLEDYAAFRAAGERRRTPWTEWPEPQRSGALEPQDYEEEAKLYYLYAQWLAEEQVAALGEQARRSEVTFYLDVPLGVHPHSYDVWRHREVFALDACGGAPPDAVFTNGQNWGFPPMRPDAMRQTGYRYLLACLRHQLAHAGLIRIDHVMGFHRLFWIPKGLDPRDGVYVRYPSEEIYALMSLESHRHHSEVVGENLGTVPGYVNAALSRHRVQQMFVVQYELQPHPETPLRPVSPNSIASLNTHDMPPWAAFLEGKDLDDLHQLGLFSDEGWKKEKVVRNTARRALAAALLGNPDGSVVSAPSAESGESANSGESAKADERKILEACLEWLAGSAAKGVLVNLEDLWLETAPQNVPGTGAERANWRRKARYALEEWSQMPQLIHLLQKLDSRRRERGNRLR